MRCLIVEDQTILLDMLSTIVDSFTEVRQVVKATTSQDAENLINSQSINLAILDLQLPDGNGSDLAEKLIQRNPKSKVIILSGSADTFQCPSNLRDAVHGVIDKRNSFAVLRDCLNAILKPAYQTLTPRQQDVFQLIGEGKTTKEIATILDSATSTVESHRKAIAQALGLSGAELVREASLARHILHQP